MAPGADRAAGHPGIHSSSTFHVRWSTAVEDSEKPYLTHENLRRHLYQPAFKEKP